MNDANPTRWLGVVFLLLALSAPACGGTTGGGGGDAGPTPCDEANPCGAGLDCVEGTCQSPDLPDGGDTDGPITPDTGPVPSDCASGLTCLNGSCVNRDETTSCEALGQCCEANDDACATPGAQCYCDEACLTYGDCCEDACVACQALAPELDFCTYDEGVDPCASCVDNQCGHCADCEGLCVPDCTLKDCGDDGCGGSCGECEAGSLCETGVCVWEGPPPDPEICTGNTQGQLQAYGGACCYTPSFHAQNPDCVWYADTYGDGECLDAECAEGFCSGAEYCSKGCVMYVDAMNNHTGAQNDPDGVMDPTVTDDCEGAEDGPRGAEYHCINLRAPDKDPYGVCRPGTTFGPCETTDDCPGGEVCTLLYILGETQSRCMTPAKTGVGTAEDCNSDPNSGPLQECLGPLCYSSFGCSDLCADDASCATDTCVNGACSKSPEMGCASHSDCSAMYCTSLSPYSNSDFEDDFCWPRECRVAGDCKDKDWFCRPYWNGADTVEEVAFGPQCRKAAEDDMAHYGEPCGNAGDGTDLPPCVWSSGCIDNYCSGPCQSDADCDGGAECLLGYEWNIDVDDDEEIDTYVNVDLCQSWPHDGDIVPCLSDQDCPADHHCEYRVKGSGDETLGERVWEVEYVCKKDYDDQVAFGQICGSGNGSCKSSLCLVPSGSDDADSMCTEYCTSATDCPDTVEFDGFTWKTYCVSFHVNGNEDLDGINDVYVPYCWRTSSIGSVDPCDDSKDCESPKDYCRAVAIAGNPDQAVTVEHLCLDSSQGLEEFPTKEVGEACESWTECNGRACYPDGDGSGYCSELCGDHDDCVGPDGFKGLACTDQVLIERPDPANSGITQRCIMQKTCLPCAADDDCGGDHLCVNIGGLGGLAEMRCGSPCQSTAQCTEADTTCITDITEKGVPTGKHACMPLSCDAP